MYVPYLSFYIFSSTAARENTWLLPPEDPSSDPPEEQEVLMPVFWYCGKQSRRTVSICPVSPRLRIAAGPESAAKTVKTTQEDKAKRGAATEVLTVS